MKRVKEFLIYVIIGLICGLVGNCALGATVSDKLLDALETVESHGNEKAIGDNGTAIGCLQIHECVVDEVNARHHASYDWEAHCFRRGTARQIARLYLSYWGGVYERRHPGRKATDQVLARIWNGGPSGWRRPSTRAYWAKVQKALK